MLCPLQHRGFWLVKVALESLEDDESNQGNPAIARKQMEQWPVAAENKGTLSDKMKACRTMTTSRAFCRWTEAYHFQISKRANRFAIK